MSTYTLTTDLIEKIDYEYYGKILNAFTIQNGNKIAVDKNFEVFSLYSDAKEKIKVCYRDIYAGWLALLANIQSKIFESTGANIDINKPDEAFLEIASADNEKTIIVFSRNLYCYKCDTNNEIDYKNNKIKVLDKDEADKKLNNTTNIYNTTYGPNSPIINGNNNTINK